MSNLNDRNEVFGGLQPNPKACKTCVHADGLPPYADGVQKGYCDIYAYPMGKPFEVYFNGADCDGYDEKE